MPKFRLDRLLSESGAYSRSEARLLIRACRVRVNGLPVTAREAAFDPETDVVTVDGVPLQTAARHVLMLHKPPGVLSATEDAAQPTVLDLLPPPLRRLGLSPAGRLDKDTTGLLLLTNDGDLLHRIISPRHHVPKRYRATLDAPLAPEDAAAFAAGITLSDGLRCLPARLEIAAERLARVTVYEGKYHQVRRMFAARGKHVLALHRECIGALELDPALPPGAFRELRPEECDALFSVPDLAK